MRGPDLFDNDLARQVRRSTHRCDLVDVVYKKLPTHSVMGPGLRKIRIVGEPEADWSALHGKEPREVIVLVYRLEPEAAEEVTLGVGVSHIQDRVERAHGHGAIITQDPSNCPGRSTASSVDGPRGGTACENGAGRTWCAPRSARSTCPVKIPAQAPSTGRARRTGLKSRRMGVRRRPIGGDRSRSLPWRDGQSDQSARGSPQAPRLVAVLRAVDLGPHRVPGAR